MSNEKALMQEAWRTGYTQFDGFVITCPTDGEATRLRFSLYAAVKQFRNGKGEPDELLATALNNCAITILPGTGVLIQRKLASEVSRSILEQLGRPPKTVDEYNAEASLARIMGKINEAAPASAPTSDPATRYGARN